MEEQPTQVVRCDRKRFESSGHTLPKGGQNSPSCSQMRHGHPGVFGFLDGCRLPPDAVRKLEELDNPNKHSNGRATDPEEVRQDEVVDSSSQVAKSQRNLFVGSTA